MQSSSGYYFRLEVRIWAAWSYCRICTVAITPARALAYCAVRTLRTSGLEARR